MIKIYYLLLFLLLSFYSCENQSNMCPDIIVTASISDFPMDLYGVNELEVIEDILHINVSYGGGCEEHEFKLINIISQIDGEGEQMNILHLSHNANNDGCFGQISEHQICFNISDLNGELFYFSHQDSLYDLN